MANLAAKGSPVDSPAGKGAILALLRLEPVLEASVMDIANATAALADRQEWILNHVRAVPTEPTKRIIVVSIVIKLLLGGRVCWFGLFLLLCGWLLFVFISLISGSCLIGFAFFVLLLFLVSIFASFVLT